MGSGPTVEYLHKIRFTLNKSRSFKGFIFYNEYFKEAKNGIHFIDSYEADVLSMSFYSLETMCLCG
jgi:hypothetical protein